jgi:hypothetical protein
MNLTLVACHSVFRPVNRISIRRQTMAINEVTSIHVSKADVQLLLTR